MSDVGTLLTMKQNSIKGPSSGLRHVLRKDPKILKSVLSSLLSSCFLIQTTSLSSLNYYNTFLTGLLQFPFHTTKGPFQNVNLIVRYTLHMETATYLFPLLLRIKPRPLRRPAQACGDLALSTSPAFPSIQPLALRPQATLVCSGSSGQRPCPEGSL